MLAASTSSRIAVLIADTSTGFFFSSVKTWTGSMPCARAQLAVSCAPRAASFSRGRSPVLSTPMTTAARFILPQPRVRSSVVPEPGANGVEERLLLGLDTASQAEHPSEPSSGDLCHLVARLDDPLDPLLPFSRRQDGEADLDHRQCHVEGGVRWALAEPLEQLGIGGRVG